MRGKLLILIVTILLLVTTPVFAAKIVGAIYDQDLTAIKKAVVTINTTPEQTKVSPYGGYHFIVDPGSYKLTVTYSKNDITKEISTEYITIETEGEYARDLFIYPGFILEEEFDDNLPNKIANFVETHGIIIGIIIGSCFILFLVTFFGTKYVKLLFKKELREYVKESKVEKKEYKEHVEPIQVPNQIQIPKSTQEKSDDMIEKKILAILAKKEHHICTQKEIRKEFRLSEAKISLTLTKMEDDKSIEKIKQGRLNMIRLIKKK